MKAQAGSRGPNMDEDVTEDVDATVVDDEPEPTREERIKTHYKLIRSVLPPVYSNDVAMMITAQAMHETGIFTSRLYREQNNLFGMRHPTIRETLSVEERNQFATFANLEDSVRDLLLYFKEFSIGTRFKDVNEYVKTLKSKGYFTDNYINYFNPVRTYYNQLKELIQ